MSAASRTSEDRSPKKVFIVDPEPIVREGLAHRIARCSDLRVGGFAARARDVLAAIARRKPDLVLMDFDLPGRDGLELIKNLGALHPDVAILVFSRHDEKLFAERVLRAGAHGYVDKRSPVARVIEAMRRVLAGQVHLSRTASAALFQSLTGRQRQAAPAPAVSLLTDRELEVFRLVGEAQETREIARRLSMSVKTVEAHRSSIKHKLELRSGPELTRHAVLWVEMRG